MDKIEGQIFFAAFRSPEPGRALTWRKKEILLDLIAAEDETVLAQEGLTALRQGRILRLATQAAEQGAVLTYHDLVQLLSSSLSTVKRDVQELQQRGFAVTICRRRGRRIETFLILLTVLLASNAEAQLSSIFGTIGFDYEYEDRQFESLSTNRQRFLQQYNLGLDGRIIDPRLATFFLSGNFNSSLLADENITAASFAGNLSLLQGAPYGLTLRAGKSFSNDGTDTNGSNIGANLRVTLADMPQFFVDFDRQATETRGGFESDLAITTGKLRFSHNFWSTMMNGEVGIQDLTDDVRNISEQRYFGRVNGTTTLSPTTTLRSFSDFFLEGNQLVASSTYSLENLPDPTLRRTASLNYRSSKAGDDKDHTIGLSGSLSKTFFPYPWLQTNTFTSAVAQKTFGDPDPAGFAWSGGTSAAIAYFRPVSLIADYALALSYETDLGEISTTQQLHFGAISRTLDPLRLTGDYFFGYQIGFTKSNRHFLVGRADAALTPQLSIRSVADFLYETVNLSEREGISTERTVANIGAGVSYRPLFNLTLDLAGNLQWSNDSVNSGTIMRGDLHASYFLPWPGTPTLNVNGRWERDNVREDNRFEVRSRLSYRIGQATLSLEHRLEHRSLQSTSELSNTIHFNLARPFNILF